MDVTCNPDLVEYIEKVKEPVRIQNNRRHMSANDKFNTPGYDKNMWFTRKAITNIIKIKNLTEQNRVTYDSNSHMLILHREKLGLPKMKFLMHDSGLH